MTAPNSAPHRYYVVLMTTKFSSLAEVREVAPDHLSAHLARSQELHAAGVLLMAGAFLDRPDEPVQTVGVLVTREAAEDYARGDPFVQADLVRDWAVREWANMLA